MVIETTFMGYIYVRAGMREINVKNSGLGHWVRNLHVLCVLEQIL